MFFENMISMVFVKIMIVYYVSNFGGNKMVVM